MNNFWIENTSWKVNFWYQWIIQYNTDSCYIKSIKSQEKLCFIWSTYVWLQQVSNFWIEKTLWKVNIYYQWIIQCDRSSCCEHIPDGFNIYLYGCVSLMGTTCNVCACVCVISIQNASKKPHVSDLDSLFHKTHSTVRSFWYKVIKVLHM